jgi:hypothetical protein
MLTQTIESEDVGDLRDLPEPEQTVSEMRMAIAAVFFEDPHTLDVRYLWTRGPLSYFRVNWWVTATTKPPHIRRSAFVVVETGEYGYRIRDRTQRHAA